MATHTVPAGKMGKHKLTVGAAEEVVEFADNLGRAMIVKHSGSGTLYATVDGSPATVAGDNAGIVIPGSAPAATAEFGLLTTDVDRVRMIADGGDVVVSVTRAY